MPFLAPIIAAGAGALGATAGTAALIGQVGSALVGLGASYALTALFGGRDQGRGARGYSQELSFGGDAPRTLAFGRLPVEGQAVDYMSSGGANMVEWEVRVLSDFQCEGLEKIWVNGKERELVEKAVEGDEDKYYWVKPWDDGGGYLQVYFYSGRDDQTAVAKQVTESNPAGHWTNDHRLRGMCFVAIRKFYDPEKFDQFPQFRFLVKGVKLYDWRLDTTAGGSGSHRWSDRSTWEWTDNPAVILYNYMRGFWRGGVRIMGMGVQPADMNLALFTAAANECDELVTLKGGGSEKRYRMAYEHADDQQHVGVIEACIAAMGGRMWERAGVYAPIPGGSRSVARTLTDGDLVASYGVRFSRRRARSELRNHITGSFTSEAEDWNAAPYPPIANPAAEAADGNERLAEVLDLPMVTSKTQAQRIALIRYNENRSQSSASIVVGLRHIDLEAGDWVTWQSARYGTRTYVIARHRLQSDLTIALELVETSAAVYGWNPIDEIDVPPSGVRPTPSPGITTVQNFAIQATLIGATTGQQLPGIRAAWDPPNDTTIIAVIIEHRPIGETTWRMERCSRPNDGAFAFEGLAGETGYEARATIETRPARRVTYTATAQITTDTIQIEVPPVDLEILVPHLFARLRELEGKAREFAAGAADLLRSVWVAREQGQSALTVAQRTLVQYTDEKTVALVAIIDQVQVELDALNGEVVLQAAAISALQASVTSINGTLTVIASQITALTSRITDAEGTITSQATAISGLQTSVTQIGNDITALAQQVDALDAIVGPVSDVFAQAGQPSSTTPYDLWIRTTDSNRVWVRGASAWAAASPTNPVPTVGNSFPGSPATGAVHLLGATVSNNSKPHLWTGATWQDLTSPLARGTASAYRALQVQVTDIDGEVTALAQEITDIGVQVDDVSANGRFVIQAAADQSGVLSRIEASVRAADASWTASAAWQLEAALVGGVRVSQMVVTADRFFVRTSGTNRQQIFAASADGVWFNTPVYVGSARKFVLDGDNGVLDIFE